MRDLAHGSGSDPGGILPLDRGPVLSSEVLPPMTPDTGPFLEIGRRLVAAGAGLLFVPDAPRGRVAVDPITAAAMLQRVVHRPCIPHLNCRDRNRIALESALISMAALDLRGAKAVTGDPVAESPRGPRGVYELSSADLIRLARDVGTRFGRPFTMVAGHVVSGRDHEPALDRLRQKVSEGVDLVMTTPTLLSDHVLQALDHIPGAGDQAIVSLALAPSLELLEVLSGDDAAFAVPEGLAQRLRMAPDAESRIQIGLDAALDVARRVRGRVRGLHVVPLYGRPEGAELLLNHLRLSLRTP